MKALKFSLIAFIAFYGTIIFSQNNERTTDNIRSSVQSDKNPDIGDYLFGEQKPDYKVISSNSSYIELEYYPGGLTKEDIEVNGERLSVYSFQRGLEKNITLSGSPDLRHRSFAVMFPSDKNNTVQIIDFDVKEEQNVNIAPIPQMNVFNPNVRSFENIYYTYNRNAEYSQNKFMPETVVSLADVGPFRDITIGNLVIYPCQYNPVTRTVKLYTRVRVRINFGEAPASLNRPRSKEEVSLLTNAAINSGNAINWVSPKYKKNYRDNVVVNSALSTGDWYKIEIKDNGDGKSDGIYKITKSFLEGAGINLSGIDPRTIKMYGNGGNMLPDRIAPDRPQDLEEIAVYIEGENDGTFDNNDHILFYGKSIHNWNYDSLTHTYGHYLNVYSRSNYYWICLNTPNNGIRMQFVPSEQSGNPIVQTSFFDRMFFEPEINNLINEGNLWLSERKSTGQSFEWNTSLPGLEGGSDIVFNVKLASRTVQQPGGTQQSNYFLVKDEYSNMSEFQFPLGVVYPGFNEWISTETYPITINQSQKTNGEQVKLRSRFYSTLNEGEGYLDWYEIVYKRRLNSAANDMLAFDSPDTTGTVEYNVSSFSNNDIKVFDASVHKNVKIIQPISVNSSNVKFQKTETASRLSRFYVVGQSGFMTPTGISSRVSNQNLHGISDGASFIIITHKDFISAAERLKNKREQGGTSDPNYLKTMVVTTEQIFYEFSGGVFDAVAIRDFIKYAFDNWTEKPVYVCLLGDGGFDYKNLLYQGGNYVPAWELTSPVIHQVNGMTTDDYFVNVVDGVYLIDRPDLAVGRIPANSLPDANAYLDKLDAYESGENNGYWKNRMLFVADDEKTSSGCENVGHLEQCESLAEGYTPPFIDKIKAYLVTYPTVITPQGRRKPQVNADIAKYWSEGVLNIHYTGHGSPDVWAHEYVLEKDNILSQINNRNRYPFVSIASCDMSKFDNPANQSAGELFMMAYNKGAIGTFAASRPVYASGNAALMYVVFDNLYIPRDTLLLPKRFGTGILNAKLQIISYEDNSAKYILMCDPSARVQLPRFRSHVDSISGLQGDTMQALSRIKIYGSILNPDSTVWEGYNGKLVLKLYDFDKHIVVEEDNCGYPPLSHGFILNGGIIYSGIQNISNGKWTAEFIVPKDISYRNQPGRLINYFFNNQYDGAGINRSFIVGGVNPNAAIDSTGPHISMFLNSRNFRTGDVVNENFKFIADLSDESGINTTGTIGHKLEGVLDGNENIKYDFTNFYNSDTTYTSGSIEFDFTNIALGRHTLKLKAWDTYNNSSENTIEFDVSSGGVLQVTNVYNFPNPFKDNTAFTFQHNYPTNINIKIKVYTVAGRLIKQIERQNIADKFVMIDWDGKDEDGETLGNGVYIYRLVVESIDGSSITNTGKLAVLK